MQEQEELGDAVSENEGADGAINIIIEPQEQETDNLKLSEEFDNERIQNTINNIALNQEQEQDELRCSIIDNKIESGEEELQNEEAVTGHAGNSMFN